MATVKPAQADALSLPEMLRIMDVATALRLDRELVEEQLNFDELKARLRARMIEAAKVTGEEVTPEEVDTAIERYYQQAYTFQEPPWSLQLVLAHLYVRRHAIARGAGLLLVAMALCWWLFLSTNAPLSARGRAHRQVESLAAGVARRAAAIRAVAQDPEVPAELARLTAEADTYRSQVDPKKLRALDARLADLETRLGEEYTVSVVFDLRDPKKKSGIDRLTVVGGQEVTGYYLIVQARRADGTILKRRVHDNESGQDRDVSTWGEQVPKAVYERLAIDKKLDGILNETTFAVKKRGQAGEEVVMPGPDGQQPLRRLGQITEW